MATPAHAIFITDFVPVSSYVALAQQTQYASTVYLADNTSPVGGETAQFCSGTLISANVVLTAAHCVDDGATGTVTPAATITTGFTANVPATIPSGNVASVVVNPGWYDKPGGDAIHDQAILTLSSPLTGVLPADIWLGNPVGMIGTLLGYGYQDTGSGAATTLNGYGYNLPGATDLLAAQNMIDALDPTFGLESDFDNPAGTTSSLGSAIPLPLEGTTCFGDSGGPLFVSVNGQALLVGDLNGGASNPYGPSCYYGDVSNWSPLDNSENVSFIANNDPAADFVSPEPASAVLIGAGLLAFVAVRRGRRPA